MLAVSGDADDGSVGICGDLVVVLIMTVMIVLEEVAVVVRIGTSCSGGTMVEVNMWIEVVVMLILAICTAY